MSDFMTGGGIDIGVLSNPNAIGPSALTPFSSNSDIGGMTIMRDDLTGAETSILHSFAGGLGTFLNTVGSLGAQSLVGSNGSVVGYDRYGAPIYRAVDPRTGGWTTLPTAAWPGGGGSMASDFQRVPQSANPSQSLWGWLVNGLSLPAPVPTATIGTTPATYGQQIAPSVLSAQGPGGLSVGQLALGAGIALIGFVILRAALK